ncbi:MAG: MopE-related protein [Myxococcota bacterium]|nr:MopE-related protein [Myxococcota bacterium]
MDPPSARLAYVAPAGVAYPGRVRSFLTFVAAMVTVACAVDTRGLGTAPVERDGGIDFDALSLDAGTSDADPVHDVVVPELDAPTTDAMDLDATRTDAPTADAPAGADAACPPGFVDDDGNPSNGCEYRCTPADDPTERCNGRDDDCRRATADGSGETWLDMPCDGPDADFCREGAWMCASGAMSCSDATGASAESCGNAIDDDCDDHVDEDDAINAVTLYHDADGDGYGTGSGFRGCPRTGRATMPGDCDDGNRDRHPAAPERCNGRDDNCTGVVDESAGCPCDWHWNGTTGHAYLFCRGTHLAWALARDFCRMRGYELATIDDATENGWIAGIAGLGPSSGARWWIGLNDLVREGEFVWSSGVRGTYRNWAMGQPNDWMMDEDCVVIADSGQWRDLDCDWSHPFVCESP